LETLRQVAIIQSTESSNRIEGVVVPEKRLKALLEKGATPKNRPEAEVMGYRDVLAKIHASFQRMELSPEAILRMHKEMFRRTPLSGGAWKRKDNTIEEHLPDGRWITRFAPVSAARTPSTMKELCALFNQLWEEQRIDRLLLLHAFVLDFLCIHPFTDGNGRISRLLTVLLLHQAGYDVGRYISIERLIEESKQSYYEVRQESSRKWHESRHRLLPWWQYSLGVLLTAYKELQERVGVVRASRGAKTAWVEEAIQHLPDTFGVGELARACPGVSRPMIRVILEKLRDNGKLEALGTGRGAMWRKRR
jgi:Fic family protein